MNPIKTLSQYGQSVWLDYIRRDLLVDGGLQRLIEQDGLSGLTSNPAIFQKAIADSDDYTSAINVLAGNPKLDTEGIYEQLAVEDLRRAADLLQPVYAKSQTRDGYVSLEVSPRLARDTKGTLAAARHLWSAVDRANLMIKIPATPDSLPAFEELIAEGINVNVTLLFSLETYAQVVEHYLRGLERRRIAGHGLEHCASVASFFVSRIDTAVDDLLDRQLAMQPGPRQQARLERVHGRTALASARLAYKRWKNLFAGDRWESLRTAGAQPQRLLWASTGTKNPAYSDLLYVDSLVACDTVTTLPPATLDALRDHGKPSLMLDKQLDKAEETLDTLASLGIDLKQITSQLLEDGLNQFETAYERLLTSLDKARRQALSVPLNQQRLQLPAEMTEQVQHLAKAWQQSQESERLWSRETNDSEHRKGGNWLDLVPAQLDRLAELRGIGHLTEGLYYRHALLIGMGGHSLIPEVLSRVFGHNAEHPEMLTLDSTDPDQIYSIQQRIDLSRSLFIIADKSGDAKEPRLLAEYFFDQLCKLIGKEQACHRFFAITEPNSPLEAYAETQGFRQVFHGKADIVGAYSAFSDFGMIPAALLGLDLERFLQRADAMVERCSAAIPAADNPAVILGAVLGTAREQGYDKVTFVASPEIEPLTLWLEELLAESTGKHSTGLIPIRGESLVAPVTYEQDRLFVYLRMQDAAGYQQDQDIARLAAAGFPIVRIEIEDSYNLGQEFFRWEMACAVAGSIMGVDPFRRPEVEASKRAIRELLTDYENGIDLPIQRPLAQAGHLTLFAEPHYAAELQPSNRSVSSLAELLGAHLFRLESGDYFALLPYLDRTDQTCMHLLQEIRLRIRDHYQVASSLGYGPGYLFSTGQIYKGGPNTGVFLILTKDPTHDLHVPHHRISFAGVEIAEALVDQQILGLRGRRVVRLHLGKDTAAALRQLIQMLDAAFSFASPPKSFRHAYRTDNVA